jgi:hypothetical protein
MSIYWLQHCNCWFGFAEPARFISHPDGGYFAKHHSTEQIFSIIQNGLKRPKGI